MSIQAVGWAINQTVGSAAQKMTLVAIANYADERGRAWPSQKKLAADTELTPRTIRAALCELEQKGIITRTERMRDDGSRASDIIKINKIWEEAISGGAEIVSGGGEPITGGVGKEFPGGGEIASGLYEPSKEPSIGTVKEKNARGRALRPPFRWTFDIFWEAYPHKIGKEAARKSFERVRGKIEFQSLMAALQRYREKTDDRPWCNPATWLNQERWNDVPAPLVVPQNRDPQKQELRDVIGQLRGNGTCKASGGRADGLLLENSSIRGPDIRGETSGIAAALSWDGEQDCESDQRDTGEVQVLSFPGRHQARA